MGTLANGIKEIFATAKTTGTNVMLCGNDGTPDGHITMANIASVLSPIIGSTGTVVKSVTDFNDEIKDTGVLARYNVSWSTSTLNAPTTPSNTDIAVLITWNWVNVYAFQIILTKNDHVIYRTRLNTNTWNPWRDFSYDIPTFYKNYSTLSLLAQAIGSPVDGGRKSSSINFDDYKTPTSFNFFGELSATGVVFPQGNVYGSAVVFSSTLSNSVYCLQIISLRGRLIVRNFWGNTGEWVLSFDSNPISQ